MENHLQSASALLDMAQRLVQLEKRVDLLMSLLQRQEVGR